MIQNKILLYIILSIMIIMPVSAYHVWSELSCNVSETSSLINFGVNVLDTIYFSQLINNNQTNYTGGFIIYNATSNITSYITDVVSSVFDFDGDETIYSSVRLYHNTTFYFSSYNINNMTWTDLTYLDTQNFVNYTSFLSLKIDTVNDLVFVGKGNGRFGYFNITGQSWTDLSDTDTGNWIGNSGTSGIRFILPDMNGNAYIFITDMTGIYNITDNVTYPLFNMSSYLNVTQSASYFPIMYGDAIYFSLSFPNGYSDIYKYNISTNTTISYIDLLPFDTPLQMVIVDDILYSAVSGQKVLIKYNMTSDDMLIADDYYDINDWVVYGSLVRGIGLYDDKLYTFVDDNDGKCLGVFYDTDTCVENWRHNDTECSGMIYTIHYTDINNCNTTTNIPSDEGQIDNCIGNWIKIIPVDTNNFIPTTTGYVIRMLYDDDDDIYYQLYSKPYIQTYIFATYNPDNNTVINITSIDMSIQSVALDSVNDIIYIGGTGGILRRYFINNNTYENLSTTDTKSLNPTFCTIVNTPNWVSTSTVQKIYYDETNNILYTGLNNGKFGYYNASDNIWYGLSATDINPTNWFGSSATIRGIALDTVNNMVYIGSNNNQVFSIYNPQVCEWTTLNTTISSLINLSNNLMNNMVYGNNHIYMTLTTNNIPKFMSYDILNNITADLTITNNGWNISGYLSNADNIYFDDTTNFVYVAMLSGYFAVYNPLTNIFYDLSDTDVDGWSDNRNLFTLSSSGNSDIYTTLDGAFGMFSFIPPSQMDLTGMIIGNTINGVTNVFIAILITILIIGIATAFLSYIGIIQSEMVLRIIAIMLVGMTILLMIIAFNMFNAV